MAGLPITLIHVVAISIFYFSIPVLSATFPIVDQWEQTVRPVILSKADSPQLTTTGFVLQKGGSKTISLPSSWGGRFWGRTHCTQHSTGKFSCIIGDCGSGKLECSGGGAAPPATLAEFKLNGYGGLDFHGVSLIDGDNLALRVVPQGGALFVIFSRKSSRQEALRNLGQAPSSSNVIKNHSPRTLRQVSNEPKSDRHIRTLLQVFSEPEPDHAVRILRAYEVPRSPEPDNPIITP